MSKSKARKRHNSVPSWVEQNTTEWPGNTDLAVKVSAVRTHKKEGDWMGYSIRECISSNAFVNCFQLPNTDVFSLHETNHQAQYVSKVPEM